MAIKISGTDVIGNSRELLNITSTNGSTMEGIVKAIITRDTIASGTTIRAGRDTVISKLSTGYIEASRFGTIQRGVINFYFEGLNTDPSGTQAAARIRRLRNGSTTTILTQSLTSTSYVAYNTDQNVLPGDVFIYQIQGGSGATGRIRNMRLRTSAGTYYIPTLISDFFGWTRSQT